MSVPRLKYASSPPPASPEATTGGVQAEADDASSAKLPFARPVTAVTRYDTLSVATALWSVQIQRRIGDCAEEMPVSWTGPWPGFGGMRFARTATCLVVSFRRSS